LSVVIWPARSSSEASRRAAAQKELVSNIHQGKVGTKESGRLRLTLELSMGLLKGGEGLGEVPVLPQQPLEQLLPGVERALHRIKIHSELCRFFAVSR
jgi:hypothetical protein